MKIFEELKNRGLLAQVTDENAVQNLLDNNKIKFYVGFDPTADSLHVGHFVQIMAISHLQKAGHIPIILFGGGTGMIGDPTGKSSMRKVMSKDEVNHNVNCFQKQMSSLVDLSENKAIILNNASWLLDLNYIDFLRNIGIHFSVNRMLAAECYKQRLENGLSFFELNYMLMQSYDFLYLNQHYDCILQLGGDDQWSNIISGTELIRRVRSKKAYGMTFNLLTTADGRKMGKTEGGAVWLDPKKTSPFDFFQYWRNVNDTDVINCMKMLTFLPLNEIQEYQKLSGSEINKAKEVLAFEVTKLIHGEDEAKKALHAAKAIFQNSIFNNKDIPYTTVTDKDFNLNDEVLLVDLLLKANLVKSKSDAKRNIEQGGVSINDRKILDIQYKVNKNDFNTEGFIIVKKGKKVFHKFTLL